LLIIISCVAFIVIVALLLGVLFSVSRKRAHGTTWFPEGFFSSSSTPKDDDTAATASRRRPDGQEMKNVHKGSRPSQMDDVDSNDNATALGIEAWSDDECTDRPRPKRFKVSLSLGFNNFLQYRYIIFSGTSLSIFFLIFAFFSHRVMMEKSWLRDKQTRANGPRFTLRLLVKSPVLPSVTPLLLLSLVTARKCLDGILTSVDLVASLPS